MRDKHTEGLQASNKEGFGADEHPGPEPAGSPEPHGPSRKAFYFTQSFAGGSSGADCAGTLQDFFEFDNFQSEFLLQNPVADYTQEHCHATLPTQNGGIELALNLGSYKVGGLSNLQRLGFTVTPPETRR